MRSCNRVLANVPTSVRIAVLSVVVVIVVVVWRLLLLLLLTQIDEPAMPMSTQLNDLIGNPGAESPGSKNSRRLRHHRHL